MLSTARKHDIYCLRIAFIFFNFSIQLSAEWELGKYRHNSNVHTVSELHGNAVGKSCGQRGTEASEPVICH